MGNSSSSDTSSAHVPTVMHNNHFSNFKHRLQLFNIPNDGKAASIKAIATIFPFSLHPYAEALLLSLTAVASSSSTHKAHTTIAVATVWKAIEAVALETDDQIYHLWLKAFYQHRTKLDAAVKIKIDLPSVSHYHEANPNSFTNGYQSDTAIHSSKWNTSFPAEGTGSSEAWNGVESSLMHLLVYAFLELLLDKFVGTAAEPYLLNKKMIEQKPEVLNALSNIPEDLLDSFKAVHSLLCSIYSDSSQSWIAISLPCLYASYKHFCKCKPSSSNLADTSTAILWLRDTLPILGSYCSSAFFSHFASPVYDPALNAANAPVDSNLTFSVYKWADKKEQPKQSSELLQRSKTASGLTSRNLNLSSDAVRGILLNHTSRCFTSELCFALSQSAKEFCANRWTRLYATWKNGTSLSALVNSTMSYNAPCILVIKASSGNVFGATFFSAIEGSGTSYFGSSRSFLFSGAPIFQIFRATGLGDSYFYINVKHKYNPLGIGFGGQKELFRLWVDDDLTRGYVTQGDSTYTAGDILLSNISLPNSTSHDSSDAFQRYFKIDALEIWGAGGMNALSEQEDHKNLQQQVRQERRILDRSKLLNSSFDKEFLFGNTFKQISRDSINPM